MKQVIQEPKKRYWLRGGVIGIVIVFIIILSLFVYSILAGGTAYTGGGFVGGGTTSFGANPISYTIFFILDIVFYLPMIILWIALFLLGVLFGWIYGKIKAKRAKSQKVR